MIINIQKQVKFKKVLVLLSKTQHINVTYNMKIKYIHTYIYIYIYIGYKLNGEN